jgi:hypothetical protein
MKTKPASVKLWWLVKNERKRKRWLVKNLKQFVQENNDYNRRARWYDYDVDNLYRDMISNGPRYHREWTVKKPTVEQLRNVTGSDNPKVGKSYVKELPFSKKKYKDALDNGVTREVKQFWGDIEFTI